ncbi:MAG: hypothetical protein KME28_11680 [Pelatocladus maniniholoensis HA4357-MV3]|jgi:hypothetical protein|uniref:Uncharacterized protein n=1 Tax=Pelatocladus maniniholoensis HA4357-MV3 TaxID=1117104 RepID=A0A9E3H7D2_9NOST|nr:hypothetical protein [Pelatocladus maniniholoensis HA4357-MV3]
MKNIKYLTSACKYCRYYQPEGRRGGMCQQLGAPVQASWKACSFALPPFAPSWEKLEDVWSLPDATPALISDITKSVTLKDEVASCTSEHTKAKVMIH